MNVAVVLADGSAAAIVAHRGDYVTLRSLVAAPPGSTLEFSHDGLSLQVKVRGCRRDGEGDLPFKIEGRLVSLTRAERARLFGAP